MAKDQSDNLDTNRDTPAQTLSGATPAPWSQNRRARALPNLDEIDTFATPSEPPADENPVPFTGAEPAVFGGVNPEGSSPTPEGQAASADAGALANPEEDPNPLSIEDPLSAEDLLGEAPKIDFVRIARSTPFLIVLMLLCLGSVTMFIQKSVKTVTFVQMVIKLVNYGKLDEDQIKALQLEINELLRSYPMRADAWDILQKRDSKMSPGFLNSGLTFHRFDSILWEKDGRVLLRIDTDDPPSDLVRLSSVAEAFYNAAQQRNLQLDKNRASLKADEASELQLLQRDAILKQQADDLLPDAQHYIDLKAALQGTQRYLDLAEESNPLRLVARENLRILTAQVAEARKSSERRDELVITRVQVQREIDDLRREITSLRRDIDCFSYPLPPDPKQISIVDTRDRRQSALRNAWIGIILTFIAVFSGIRYAEYRAADIERRERRLRRSARETKVRPGKRPTRQS